jgi:ribonuclease BN (tRNA processing enzyme)
MTMRARFWGTRGSLPTPGAATARYGGNTSCVEIKTGRAEHVVIVDAGTGIRLLDEALGTEVTRVDLLLGHLHMDHIVGKGGVLPANSRRLGERNALPWSSERSARSELAKRTKRTNSFARPCVRTTGCRLSLAARCVPLASALPFGARGGVLHILRRGRRGRVASLSDLWRVASR